jgi:lysophospholipase L1-like esterase
MPVISRNVPAYATNAVYPASFGNDASYDTQYRGSPPTSLIYDLSGVPAAQRGQVLVAWYNGKWYPPATGDPYYNTPRDYTIDASAAAGGGQPPSPNDPSWTTLLSVTGNIFGSRQYLLNFAGYSWLRMRVLASSGSTGNTDAAFNLDVHDASRGAADTWVFFGDSITMDDMYSDEPLTFAQRVNAGDPPFFPSQIDGGVGGWTAASPLRTDPATGRTYWSEFLAATPARYVSVDFGTNDANGGVAPATFRAEMQTLVSAVEAAGKVPVVRLIPWGCTAGIQANAPALNQQIQALWAADPQIIRGPDFWTYFSQNPTLISPDCVHPVLPTGAHAYRQLYAQAMLTNVYGR